LECINGRKGGRFASTIVFEKLFEAVLNSGQDGFHESQHCPRTQQILRAEGAWMATPEVFGRIRIEAG
jgi:hypothetical protein